MDQKATGIDGTITGRDYREVFPSTVNNARCMERVREAAMSCGLETIILDTPCTWSEDFAYFTSRYHGCLFGLGAGKEQKPIHSPAYDFPDEIIDSGVGVLWNIYKSMDF